MKITKRQLRRLIQEAMELDLEIGDVILAGKFKNKRKIVKTIGSDDLGQPTINGMKVLNFRIEKLMPKDKWSKKSKEALEFADGVNEMKITKRQLKRIIKEALIREMDISRVDVEQYIKDKADAYRSDPTMTPDSMRMLLMDDFMDDVGHQHDIRDFQDLIDAESLGRRR